MLIENVSQWLVTAQHARGERCPSFCAQTEGCPYREVTEPCQTSRDRVTHATYQENGPLILLAVLQKPLATLLRGCPKCWGCQEQLIEVLNNMKLLYPTQP